MSNVDTRVADQINVLYLLHDFSKLLPPHSPSDQLELIVPVTPIQLYNLKKVQYADQQKRLGLLLQIMYVYTFRQNFRNELDEFQFMVDTFNRTTATEVHVQQINSQVFPIDNRFAVVVPGFTECVTTSAPVPLAEPEAVCQSYNIENPRFSCFLSPSVVVPSPHPPPPQHESPLEGGLETIDKNMYFLSNNHHHTLVKTRLVGEPMRNLYSILQRQALCLEAETKHAPIEPVIPVVIPEFPPLLEYVGPPNQKDSCYLDSALMAFLAFPQVLLLQRLYNHVPPCCHLLDGFIWDLMVPNNVRENLTQYLLGIMNQEKKLTLTSLQRMHTKLQLHVAHQTRAMGLCKQFFEFFRNGLGATNHQEFQQLVDTLRRFMEVNCSGLYDKPYAYGEMGEADSFLVFLSHTLNLGFSVNVENTLLNSSSSQRTMSTRTDVEYNNILFPVQLLGKTQKRLQDLIRFEITSVAEEGHLFEENNVLYDMKTTVKYLSHVDAVIGFTVSRLHYESRRFRRTPVIPDERIYMDGGEELLLTAVIVSTGHMGHYEAAVSNEAQQWFWFNDMSPTLKEVGGYDALLKHSHKRIQTHGSIYVYSKV